MPIPMHLLKYFPNVRIVKEPTESNILDMSLDEFEQADMVLEIQSRVLGENVYFVSNEAQLNGIADEGKVVYFARELKQLIGVGIKPEILKEIHLAKKTLGKGARYISNANFTQRELGKYAV